MKNTTNTVRSLVRSVLTPAAFVCMLITTVPSNAHATEKSVPAENPLEVKYLGKIDYQPVYQITFDNLKEELLYLTLRDEDGNLLYSDSFKDKKFSKKFLFDVADPANLKVKISLASKKDKKTQVLEFSNVTKTYEDVVVTRIN